MNFVERDHFGEMMDSGLASLGAAIESCEKTIKAYDRVLRRRS